MKAILFFVILSFTFQAKAMLSSDLKVNVKQLQKHAKAQALGTLKLPWTVGETANYNLNISIFTGKMSVEVKSETGNGFWVNQDTEMLGNKIFIEMLFDKETGELLEMRVDGQKQDLPKESDSEVIEQREESVTVPAGVYNSIYVKMKEEDQETEMWVNPVSIPIFGLLKQIAQSKIGPVIMELTSFKDL